MVAEQSPIQNPISKMAWAWFWPFRRRRLSREQIGALGERHAARHLRANGLQLLEANFRCKVGELDLVARDGHLLVFVEVRTRTARDAFSPQASVNAAKQARVVRAAHAYMRRRRLSECYIRYDIVEVFATPTGAVESIRHIPGAFHEPSERRRWRR